MAFDGSEGAPIPLELAAEATARYRAAGEKKRAYFFGREILQQILDQDGCMGIRIYPALDEKGTSQMILVGADAGGRDLHEGVVADYASLCPNDCDNASPLNTR